MPLQARRLIPYRGERRTHRAKTLTTSRSSLDLLQGPQALPVVLDKARHRLGAFLADKVVEELGHTHWTFTMPKMLRPYFMHNRELLGRLPGVAHATPREPRALGLA